MPDETSDSEEATVNVAVISGMGVCLPRRIVSNDEIAPPLDVSDEWIRTRTGIARRHRIEAGTSTSDLAAAAGRAALESAGVGTADMVLLATSTPDRKCPSTAPEVAWRLGLGEAPALDVNAACSGFIYALALASSHIRSGAHASVLVIGADCYSTIVDPADRSTAVLFGDGAGAMVVRAGEEGEPGSLLATTLGSDGSGGDFAAVAAGGSRLPHGARYEAAGAHHLALNGRQIYLQAIRRMSAATKSVVAAAGWAVDDLEALVAHQANQRILDAVGKRLGLSPGRLVGNIEDVGNTAAASVPLAMADAAERKCVPVGGRTALTAFGAGLTWGAVAATWPAATPVTSPAETRA
ncbi:ketoacyl-ACP synthase III [Streptomyces sp. A15ISP2-DRY2]|uniref:Beta-ketoacyl-[acyl-carrier-protein] synthase III n=1 Tax=Streptomyces ortus TaxID=2867268 RepID=A0ABT3VKL5_9ACTN|nr:beta-ketoacyl-ACP synthase III [Streptomyces ortus]MCX4238858.1 ketoacyl-ACP synthase III [Streptomyces ortus]